MRWRSASGSVQVRVGGPPSRGSSTSRTPRASASGFRSRRQARTTSSGWQDRGRGSGGRATYIRSRRMRWARFACPMIARSDREAWGSVSRARSNWARPTMTASGLFSSWPAPAANSARASSLSLREASLLVLQAVAVGAKDRVEPRLHPGMAGHVGGPGPPGPEGRRAREVEGGFGAVEVLPQVHLDVRPAPIREGDDPPGGPFGRDLPGRPLDPFVRPFDRPALLGGPDDARGDDPGLATPDLPRARPRRRALRPRPTRPVRSASVRRPPAPSRVGPGGCGAGHWSAPAALREGWRRGRRNPGRNAPGLPRRGREGRAPSSPDREARGGAKPRGSARRGHTPAARGPGGPGPRRRPPGRSPGRRAARRRRPRAGRSPSARPADDRGCSPRSPAIPVRGRASSAGRPRRARPRAVAGRWRPAPTTPGHAGGPRVPGARARGPPPRVPAGRPPGSRPPRVARVSSGPRPHSPTDSATRTARRRAPGGAIHRRSGLGPAPSRGRRRVRPPPSARRTRRRPGDRARLPTRRARASPWSGARGVRPAARWRGGRRTHACRRCGQNAPSWAPSPRRSRPPCRVRCVLSRGPGLDIEQS